jgi:hypothetical protein
MMTRQSFVELWPPIEVPHFANYAYFVTLHDTGVTYLDPEAEYSGHVYLL